MSNTYNSASALFTGICDAIRTKDGTSAGIAHQDIPARILAIPSGGGGSATLIHKNITQNGTYSAANDNADGYDEVSVSVQPVLITKRIEQNGTYYAQTDNPNADGFGVVIVDVQGGGGINTSDFSYMFYETARRSEYADIMAAASDLTNISYMIYRGRAITIDLQMIFSKLKANQSPLKAQYAFSTNSGNEAYRHTITNISTADWSKVTDLQHAFEYCYSSNDEWVISNLSRLGNNGLDYAFYTARGTRFDLSQANCTINSLSNTFSGLTASNTDTTYIDISGITLNGSMSNCFNGRKNLKIIIFGNNLHPTTLDYCFADTGIETLDMSVFDQSNITSATAMVQKCVELESITNIDFHNIQSHTISILGTTALPNIKTISFVQNGQFVNKSYSNAATFNLTRATGLTAAGYETLIGSLADLTNSDYTASGRRIIKIYTNLYNSLTAEQKAMATNKGYELSYGTS